MNHPDFTDLRRRVDEAITFDDRLKAQSLALTGLRLAQERKCPGEEMYFRAQLKIVEENYPEAVQYLDQALRHNPQDGAAYNDKALCLIEMGVLEGAEELFNKGIEVEPDYATVYHNKGWLLNKLGRHEEALGCFERALALDPGRAVTYENMADACENAGRIREALAAYKKALELVHCSGRIRGEIKKEIDRLENSNG